MSSSRVYEDAETPPTVHRNHIDARLENEVNPLISESTKELLRALSPKEIHELLAPFRNGSPVIKNYYTLFYVKNPTTDADVPVTAAELIAALGAPVSFDDGGNYYLELSNDVYAEPPEFDAAVDSNGGLQRSGSASSKSSTSSRRAKLLMAAGGGLAVAAAATTVIGILGYTFQ